MYGEPKAILPINVMEFLDYCSLKNKVDFYICSSETFGNNGTITYVLSRDDIENAKNKSVPILGKELVDLEINTISGNIFVPFSK